MLTARKAPQLTARETRSAGLSCNKNATARRTARDSDERPAMIIGVWEREVATGYG